ncbi:class-II fumarase/aspartase family protein [Propionibacterium freudenreichii]|uniref:class-II fumarase/aspartase family protein n=1 Tax=Propionibacterium freudenreichii TaxID=1744 RepID=UPI0021A8446C|nr:adenylosuccinate lyase family protein [Propionibacterium freudenreichii]MCT2991022.1 adenylosuccinate lyase family protein [Propionibacterium freudenreichii]MDK9651728.1 adenylosuccinate lyase family protein [Propionibacterium freudenreichii]MDK9665280.1 adenylosuccinate lyase family protein [Propionibacterium freudenreichii]
MVATHNAPFSMLWQFAGNATQCEIYSAQNTIDSLLRVEAALAQAQGEQGVISVQDATAIKGACVAENIDHDELWASARNVGYPIFGLVRQISEHLPEGPDGRVHYGATTQDIMDSGLALQMSASLEALDAQLQRLGDALATQADRYKDAVMAGRTHAQQAVPTTFGASIAVVLDELRRQREPIASAHESVRVISMFGAGGTNAAQGPHSIQVRGRVAELLGLRDTDVPWHVDRDRLSEYGFVCATLCGSLAKLARDIVDLSRTEIGEVFEPFNEHRGASSTMPQKVNPISSELIIGISASASALLSAFTRIQEAGHQRAAGEWQAEWLIVPTIGALAGSALDEAIVIAEGMRVDTERMKANLRLDGGLIMAEAQMIQLADHMGREHAHDLVYAASERARAQGTVLGEALREVADEQGKGQLLPDHLVAPQDYVGEASHIVETAISNWQGSTPLAAATEHAARR